MVRWRLITRHPQRPFWPKHNARSVCSVHVGMNYSSPSRLEAGVSPRESLPPHIWIPEPFFFLVPVLAPGLLALICDATSVSLHLFLLLFFFSLWFGVCSLGLHRAAKSLQVPDVSLCSVGKSRWPPDNRWSRLPGEEPPGRTPEIVSEPWKTPHSQKWKHIPENYFRSDFLWMSVCSYHFIFSQLGE